MRLCKIYYYCISVLFAQHFLNISINVVAPFCYPHDTVSKLNIYALI